MLDATDDLGPFTVNFDRSVGVFVVDDHAVVRRGLRAYLEVVDDMEVVGEAADGQAALEGIAALVAAGRPPDVALMDLVMPGMDGVTRSMAPSRPVPPGTCSRTPKSSR